MFVEYMQHRWTGKVDCLDLLDYTSRLCVLGLVSISVRILRSDLVKVWKSFLPLVDVDLLSVFDLANNDSTQGYAFKLTVFRCHSETKRRFLSVRCVRGWNQLAMHMVGCGSLVVTFFCTGHWYIPSSFSMFFFVYDVLHLLACSSIMSSVTESSSGPHWGLQRSEFIQHSSHMTAIIKLPSHKCALLKLNCRHILDKSLWYCFETCIHIFKIKFKLLFKIRNIINHHQLGPVIFWTANSWACANSWASKIWQQ
jgi:hypothetical protein